MTLRSVFLMASAVFLSGCATTKMDASAPASENTKVDVSRTYEQDIERYSAGDTEYSGFYNNFEFKATILNSHVRSAMLTKRTAYYQWTDAQASSEREKSNQEMSSQTKVFMAFFTPNPKNDNLMDDKTIWRIYLDAGGRRYEGKPKRIRLLLAELQSLYPYMNRWATPYEVTFDVPTAAVESGPSTYTVTGPLGTRSINFVGL